MNRKQREYVQCELESIKGLTYLGVGERGDCIRVKAEIHEWSRVWEIRTLADFDSVMRDVCKFNWVTRAGLKAPGAEVYKKRAKS